jgi:hypothetical protein
MQWQRDGKKQSQSAYCQRASVRTSGAKQTTNDQPAQKGHAVY